MRPAAASNLRRMRLEKDLLGIYLKQTLILRADGFGEGSGLLGGTGTRKVNSQARVAVICQLDNTRPN